MADKQKRSASAFNLFVKDFSSSGRIVKGESKTVFAQASEAWQKMDPEEKEVNTLMMCEYTHMHLFVPVMVQAYKSRARELMEQAKKEQQDLEDLKEEVEALSYEE